MFEIGYLCPKSGKEMEERQVRGEKIGFGAERNGLQWTSFFKMELFTSIIFFLSIFKWLLMLTVLSPESCL